MIIQELKIIHDSRYIALHGDWWSSFCDTVIGGTTEGQLFHVALVCGQSCTQEVFLKTYIFPTALYCKMIADNYLLDFDKQCRIYFSIIRFGIFQVLVNYTCILFLRNVKMVGEHR